MSDHAAWLIPRFRSSEIQSPFYRAMGGPFRGKLVEFGETVLAHLPEVGKDLEIQHQNWQTDGNPACGWERATSQTNTLSERTMESCMREVYDDSQRNSWSEEKPQKQSSRLHRSRGSMTTDDASDPRVVPEAHEQESPNEESERER